MKKFMLTLCALFCVVTATYAQDQQDYNIKVEKTALVRFLDITEVAGDKMDKWQTELQTKIDEAVKLPAEQRSQTLNTLISAYLDQVKEYLRPDTFNKYANVFRNTLKNKHLDELMK